MDLAAIKQRVLAEVDRRAELLLSVSHEIHAHPELGFEEHTAHALLSDALEREGLAITRSAYDLPTAFDARAGSHGPTVAVLCEYDALPGLGHGCGHNIIAAAGLGAGLAVAGLADELGGRLAVLGTPAEEGGGGKVFMLERGAFAGVDAAMMVHPAGAELRTMRTLAIHQLRTRYDGRAAHAAAAPWAGANALDAAVLGYVNVAALRQHIRADERVHGIFTEAGDRPNIVPDHAASHWYVRSGTRASLQDLKARVLTCLEAGAAAAGCAMHHEWVEPPYDDMVDNVPLIDLYSTNARLVGRAPVEATPERVVTGSTDMGNVSHAVPSIHPMVQAAPEGVAIHTAEFARHARSELGDRAVIDGAKMLALTVVDLWLDADARAAVRAGRVAAT
ncbi:MAG TPA: amidohydrolase [Acidimicrobiales bacterium]|jgi:amidohydrolase|nr:amidohydrolase [Acidimicrobiales bacterium]